MNRTLLPLALLVLSGIASAQTTFYRYSQDLSGLALATPGLSDRTLVLDLQLSDGSQSGNGSSRVSISGLRLTGGTFGASLGDIGNVQNPTSEIVILRDTASSIGGLADSARTFTIPVGAVAPRLEFIFNVDAYGVDDPEDYFSVSFLTSNGGTLSSVNTTGRVGSEFAGYGVTRNPAPVAYDVETTFAAERTAAGDPRFAALARPVITTTPVPEPATLAVLGVGAAAVLRRRRA